jgi:tRNA C32,U32 (ribose-2'-O)-methylase TrmJ
MGYDSLALADCPAYDEGIVRGYALAAYDLYESAERFASLEPALEGASMAVGVSRRLGKKRKESLSLTEFAASYAAYPGTVAMVFGNERDGLSDRELALCDRSVYIPSSELFPSLNLSHAVQLVFWELRRAQAEARAAAASPTIASARPGSAAPRGIARERAKAIADRLQAAGFFKIAGRPENEAFLAEIMARAGLSEAEAARFEGLFTKLAALESKSP